MRARRALSGRRTVGLALALGAAVSGCSTDAARDATVAREGTAAPDSAATVSTLSSESAAAAVDPPSSEPSATGASSGSTEATDATDATEASAAPGSATIAAEVSVESLAAAITAAVHGVRDLARGADETAAFGRMQQRAYRLLSQHADWDAAVRALLPDDVLAPYDANVSARRAVADHAAKAAAASPPGEPSATMPATLPAWTIVAPEPAAALLAYYDEAAALTGVPWQYLAAINLIETRMGRIVGVSSAGAVGPMQFLPDTWAACCTGDVTDARDAIIGAATYLVDRGAPADMRAALYGYNPNDGYVGAVLAYAGNLATDRRAYFGYHAWEVYVPSSAGTIRLPIGYSSAEPVDALAYAAAHPGDIAPVSD